MMGGEYPIFGFVLYSYSQEFLLSLGQSEMAQIFFDLLSILVYRNLYCFHNRWRIPNFDLFSILSHRNFYRSQDWWRIPVILFSILVHRNCYCSYDRWRIPNLICPLFLLTGIFIVPRVVGDGPIFLFILYFCLQELVLFL